MKVLKLVSIIVFYVFSYGCDGRGNITSEQKAEAEKILYADEDSLSDEELEKKYYFMHLTADSYYLDNGKVKSAATKDQLLEHGFHSGFYADLQKKAGKLDPQLMDIPFADAYVYSPQEMEEMLPLFYPERLVKNESRIKGLELLLFVIERTSFTTEGMLCEITEEDLVKNGFPGACFRKMHNNIKSINNFIKINFTDTEERPSQIEDFKSSWENTHRDLREKLEELRRKEIS